jgi:hypothetical protein
MLNRERTAGLKKSMVSGRNDTWPNSVSNPDPNQTEGRIDRDYEKRLDCGYAFYGKSILTHLSLPARISKVLIRQEKEILLYIRLRPLVWAVGAATHETQIKQTLELAVKTVFTTLKTCSTLIARMHTLSSHALLRWLLALTQGEHASPA